MATVVERMAEFGVVPVVKIKSADMALPLAAALKAGGLCCAEITFRTDAAEESIKKIKKAYPEFLIIAGTVLSVEQADIAMAAGAEGIVSPGFNPEVVKHCLKKGYPVVPGVCTPTEAEAAMALGLKYLKFFPAEAAGGAKMVNAMAAPYRGIKFMPTGGITLANLENYLSLKCVFSCGGSWLTPENLITEGRYDEIEKLAREAVELVGKINA